MVEYHIGEFHTVTSSMEIVSHTFEGGWGVQKSSTMKIPTYSLKTCFAYILQKLTSVKAKLVLQ